MGVFFLWYLVVLLLGWLTFPLAYKLLPGLPERGYTLARALGLLLWGYFFWLLGSLGILQNDLGGIAFAFVLLLSLSIWAGWRDRFAGVWGWVKEHKGLILTSEVIFLLAFAVWTLVRATSPEVFSTEKPMEMAFLNAILHSPTFPPHDPWLSGYAISYYYFGYVIVSILVKVTGVASPVGFNLAVALWFALAALGAYGLLYNLLTKGKEKKELHTSPGWYALPILGPLFLLIVSNFEGILDVLHSRGLFWATGADGKLTSSFWHWLNIQELDQAPTMPFSWVPTRPGGIVWWRASRVVQDFRLDGISKEVIDEFPFFSYLLGDLHPHVLAMPFALLAIALALNFYFKGKTGEIAIKNLKIPLSWEEFLVAAVALGGMAFLNIWDFPIYVVLFSGVYVLAQYQKHGWSIARVWELITLGIALGLAGFILYFPFYAGFQSQASGIMPSLIFFTPGVHFWVMFGPLLIPMILLLFVLWRRQKQSINFRQPIKLVAIFLASLLALSFLWGIAISLLPALGSMFLDSQGALDKGIGRLLSASLVGRLEAPGTWLTLGLLLVVILALIPHPQKQEEVSSDENARVYDSKPQSYIFVLLLMLLGALLTLFPENFYLLDEFGDRMNTIFKFYFQTWIVWSVAASFAAGLLIQELRGKWGAVYRVGLIVLLAITFTYPAFSLPDKTSNFKPAAGLSLNGAVYLAPDDATAIAWLQTQPLGVVCEAIGGQYSAYARVATFSGFPTVLGWPGHVSQWRGGTREIGTRQTDVDLLYRTADWSAAAKILQQYDIKYVFIGAMERSTYRVNEVKFQNNLQAVYQKGEVTIYEVPDTLPLTTTQTGIGPQ